MSTWSAGSITGSIGLDISEYSKGIIEASGLAEVFPEAMTTFLVDPLLGVVVAAKEAAEALIDTFKEVADDAANLSLMAERAGVTVEAFSTLAEVGKTVGVSVEALSGGFRFLQRNAADAVEGNAAAAKGFEQIGISVDWLKDHLNDSGAIFEAVHDRIAALPDAAQRTAAGMAILGRGASELVPLLDLPKAKFDELAGTMKNLGAVEDEEGGKAGRSWLELTSIASAAWEGVKKAFAEPILEKLGGSVDDMIPKIESFAQTLRGVVAEALDAVTPAAKGLWDVFAQLGPLVGETLVSAFELLAPVLKVVAELIQGLLEAVSILLEPFRELASGIADAFGSAPTPATEGSGDGSAGVHIDKVEVAGVDTEAAASQIAGKLAPQIRDAYAKQQHGLHRAAAHAKVARAVRGGHG